MFQREFTRITDKETIIEFLSQYNFGQIITPNPLSVTHLPFIINEQEGQLQLKSHMARSNDHWNYINGQEVLLVFQGPHGYISPRVYQEPNVPTWNYSAVHLRGTATVIEDMALHQKYLHQLVHLYEDEYEQWNFDMLDPNKLKGQYKRSVSFVVDIDRIDAKFKMSQNKSLTERKLIIDELKNGPCENRRLAHFMETHVI